MNPEKIGAMIKEIRTKEHLTQQEFANLFGVTYQAVSKWENGRNIPDIAILTDICNRYSYDIQNFLTGNVKKKSQTKIWIFAGLFSLALLFTFLLNLFPRDTFQFKTLSSNCDSFKITGSMAYNKEKTAIYISDVSYCGDKEERIFSDFTCTLYEAHNEEKIKIDSCDSSQRKNITLEEFLSEIKFQIDDYNSTCKNYTEHSLFIEIDAKESNGNIMSYKIPLSLDGNCSLK